RYLRPTSEIPNPERCLHKAYNLRNSGGFDHHASPRTAQGRQPPDANQEKSLAAEQDYRAIGRRLADTKTVTLVGVAMPRRCAPAPIGALCFRGQRIATTSAGSSRTPGYRAHDPTAGMVRLGQLRRIWGSIPEISCLASPTPSALAGSK